MRISRSERWGTLAPATQSGSSVKVLTFQPGNSGLPYLDRVANLFDTYMCRRLRVLLKSASGTVQSGMVHMGIDYDARRLPKTEEEVLGSSQLLSVPIWKSGSISPDLSIINRGGWRPTWSQWLEDAGFFSGPSFAACVSNSSSDGIAEIWLDYDLEFRGFSLVQGGTPWGSPRLMTRVVYGTWKTNGEPTHSVHASDNGPGTDFGQSGVPWSLEPLPLLHPPIPHGGLQIDVHNKTDSIRSVGMALNFDSDSNPDLYQIAPKLGAWIHLGDEWVEMTSHGTEVTIGGIRYVSLNFNYGSAGQAWPSDDVYSLTMFVGGPPTSGEVTITGAPVQVIVDHQGW